MQFIEEGDLASLLLENYLILDVRSEGEFLAGTFPGAINLPILTNPERAGVGTTYKLSGQESAISLGRQLVSGDVKIARVKSWLAALSNNPHIALYCSRGGLRSKYAQEWLADAGLSVPRIRGGYKVLRTFLIQTNCSLPEKFNFNLISGKTGSGKTIFLSQLEKFRATIDLEKVANHRGSAFGNVYGGQATQVNFENLIAESLLRLEGRRDQNSDNNLFVEAESRRIGKNFIPLEFWQQMSLGEIFVLEVTLAERVERILEDYVRFIILQKNLISADSAISELEMFLLTALRSIAKHLGSELSDKVERGIKEAIEMQQISGELELHKNWIELLLVKYYDPHYEKHIEKCERGVVMRAEPDEMLEYLESN